MWELARGYRSGGDHGATQGTLGHSTLHPITATLAEYTPATERSPRATTSLAGCSALRELTEQDVYLCTRLCGYLVTKARNKPISEGMQGSGTRTTSTGSSGVRAIGRGASWRDPPPAPGLPPRAAAATVASTAAAAAAAAATAASAAATAAATTATTTAAPATPAQTQVAAATVATKPTAAAAAPAAAPSSAARSLSQAKSSSRNRGGRATAAQQALERRVRPEPCEGTC